MTTFVVNFCVSGAEGSPGATGTVTTQKGSEMLLPKSFFTVPLRKPRLSTFSRSEALSTATVRRPAMGVGSARLSWGLHVKSWNPAGRHSNLHMIAFADAKFDEEVQR